MLRAVRDSKSGGRKITFKLPADHPAGTTSVVGNFNDWTPGVHVFRKRGDMQSVSVVVPADYIAVFRYLGEDGRWFDEPEASFVDHGASVLLAPEPKPVKEVVEKKAPKKRVATPKKAAAKAPGPKRAKPAGP